jgi:hypothetical protein
MPTCPPPGLRTPACGKFTIGVSGESRRKTGAKAGRFLAFNGPDSTPDSSNLAPPHQPVSPTFRPRLRFGLSGVCPKVTHGHLVNAAVLQDAVLLSELLSDGHGGNCPFRSRDNRELDFSVCIAREKDTRHAGSLT